MAYQLLKSIKENRSQFGRTISKYLNYFFSSLTVNSINIKDYEQFYLLYPFSPYSGHAVDGLWVQGLVSCVIHPLPLGKVRQSYIARILGHLYFLLFLNA